MPRVPSRYASPWWCRPPHVNTIWPSFFRRVPFPQPGMTPLPQREVARQLKISRSYVSRIEKRALEKLRDGLNREDFLAD